jgi:von Willebrand factor type D domain
MNFSILGVDLTKYLVPYSIIHHRDRFDTRKPMKCDRDEFVSSCMVCTALSTYFGQSCKCNSLNIAQENMRKNLSWISKLTPKIKEMSDKCVEQWKCRCGKGCSGSGGDPHFRTLDGTLYSYHGECDLVMARSPTYGSGMGFDMHARTSIVGDWSLISNLAVRVGDDTFELDNDGVHYLNGDSNVELPIMLSGKYQVTKGEDTIESFDQNDGKDITQVMYTINLENGDKILLSIFKQMISVSVEGRFEGTHGMLGTYGVDGLVGRDGITVHAEANRMGAEWQVNPEIEPSLFHEIGSGPQYPEQCKLPVVNGRRLRTHSEQFRRRAQEACAIAASDLVEKCYEDVLMTGDIDIAYGYAF